MKKHQKGFSAVEIVLLIIIVGLIGFVGWYVFHAKNNANSTYNAATSQSGTTKNTTKTTSEQPNKTKYSEFFSAFSLAKLAIGKQISPPANMPTSTTSFTASTDQFCTNMTVKKLISASNISDAIYNVSTKQNDKPKAAFPRDVSSGNTIGCETMPVSTGSYEYKAYIGDVLVVDLPFIVK